MQVIWNKVQEKNFMVTHMNSIWLPFVYHISLILCLFVGAVGWAALFPLIVDLVSDLAISVAIEKAELMGGEVAVNFLGWFLWKDLIKFPRYYTAEASS